MIEHINAYTLPAVFALLPRAMESPAARAMLLAVGLQESKFAHRSQVGGPARGFWQFERAGGVAGVLTHPGTGPIARNVCANLVYTPDAVAIYEAITDNDVLACCFARLLLWTLPGRLATRDETDRGWGLYVDAWRPGKPHRDTWDEYFARAWAIVDDDQS